MHTKSYLESLWTHLSRSDDRDIIVNKDRVVKVVRAVDKLIVIALVDVTERRENVGYLCLQYKSRSVQCGEQQCSFGYRYSSMDGEYPFVVPGYACC